jgi:succinate dehydrogenase / fumarate reductase, membrane anchor subunit
MATRSPIGRVRGLGSAKEGAHHWWHQRVTAGANLLLMTWFVIAIAMLPSYDFRSVTEWLHSPWVAIPLILLIINVFYHFRLGLQVVIEDYSHAESRVALLLLTNLFTIAMGATAIFSVLRIAFTGTPA